MIRIGITGQSGFIGTHLYNTLGLCPESFERISLRDDYFNDKEKLNDFVKHCDVIVHLAALNRHNDHEMIYETNICLVKQLISACEETESVPHIIFTSSTQEEKENLYGKSKKLGRELLEQWATKNNAPFTGLIIPNVFGPFGNPYYNSVVATFCHQLTHNEQPVIEADNEMKLIYVSELVEVLIQKIKVEAQRRSRPGGNKSIKTKIESIRIPYTSGIKVSELLKKLQEYRTEYYENGIIPNIQDPFSRNLFNTFVTYIDYTSFFPFYLKLNIDSRCSFVEAARFNSSGQVSFSTTVPGVSRGNHFHTRKAERFAVIKGKARIEFRRIGTNKVFSFDLDGKHPSFVDMPVWYTHNIKNIGSEELYVIFWTSEHFNDKDPDTYFETL